MPMPGLIYKYDDQEVQERLRSAIKHCTDLTPAMEIIGEMGIASMQKTFDEGGRPGKWPDLAASTKAQRQKVGKWPGQILVRSGELKKISASAGPRSVIFTPGAGANDYAAIQHFGGMAGRGRKTKIPPRAFLLLQDEDVTEINGILADFIAEEEK